MIHRYMEEVGFQNKVQQSNISATVHVRNGHDEKNSNIKITMNSIFGMIIQHFRSAAVRRQ